MKQWKIGRVTLALTLIFIGISILASLFYDNNFMYWTIRFWPLIIVILGGEILVSAFFSGNDKIKVKIDAVSIVLTIVLLGIFTAIGVGTHFAKDFKGINHFGIKFNDYSYSKTLEKKLSLKNVKDLEIENRHSGNIDIVEAQGNEVEVIASIALNYNDDKIIEETLEKTISLTEGANSKISINDIENRDIEMEKADLKVKVPKNINVNLKSSYGHINALNVKGDLNFDSKNGAVDIKDITGKVTGSNSYGNINVSSAGGEVRVSTKNGDLEIKNVAGNLYAENSYGKTLVDNVTGNLELSANNGTIIAKNIKGTSNISSKYGEMDLQNLIKSSKIDSKNGNVKLSYSEKLQGDVDVQSSCGDVSVKLVNGQEGIFNCITKHGNVDTSLQLQKNTDDSKDKSIKGNIGGATNRFNVNSKNGSITID